jgi:hypothetical protein
MIMIFLIFYHLISTGIFLLAIFQMIHFYSYNLIRFFYNSKIHFILQYANKFNKIVYLFKFSDFLLFFFNHRRRKMKFKWFSLANSILIQNDTKKVFFSIIKFFSKDSHLKSLVQTWAMLKCQAWDGFKKCLIYDKRSSLNINTKIK